MLSRGDGLKPDQSRAALTGTLSRPYGRRAGIFIVPIPGAKSRKHFEENVGAADIVLTEDDLAESTASSRPAPPPARAIRSARCTA